MAAAPNSVLVGLAPHLPLYLVWLAGIILALVRWRQHPRASLLTVIALGVFILDAVLGVLTNLWVQQVVQAARSGSGLSVGEQLAIISIVRSAVDALLATVGFGLLVAAALISRRRG